MCLYIPVGHLIRCMLFVDSDRKETSKNLMVYLVCVFILDNKSGDRSQ